MEVQDTQSASAGLWRRLMPPRWLRKLLSGLIALALLAGAAWVLWWRLQDLEWSEVTEAIDAISTLGLAMAVLSTVGTYVALSGFDMLGVRILGARVPMTRAALTGFIAQSLSHTVGFGTVTGPAVRWRLYRKYGVGPGQVGLIVVFVFWTFTLGALPLGVVALATQAERISVIASVPESALWSAAVGLAVVLSAYLWLSIRRQPLTFRGRRMEIPGWRISLWQIGLGLVDILFAAAIFWWLMPEGAMPFPRYMALYMLTIVAGVLTHIPGGIGVFEAMMLLFFPDQPAATVLGAVLVYRLLYNLIPLALALVAFGWIELRQRLA